MKINNFSSVLGVSRGLRFQSSELSPQTKYAIAGSAARLKYTCEIKGTGFERRASSAGGRIDYRRVRRRDRFRRLHLRAVVSRDAAAVDDAAAGGDAASRYLQVTPWPRQARQPTGSYAVMTISWDGLAVLTGRRDGFS
jgi:hypothetical protein